MLSVLGRLLEVDLCISAQWSASSSLPGPESKVEAPASERVIIAYLVAQEGKFAGNSQHEKKHFFVVI